MPDNDISAHAAGARLRISVSHVRWLVDAGELAGKRLSSGWAVSLTSIGGFEAGRSAARASADRRAAG
jgi:hypothetical protein